MFAAFGVPIGIFTDNPQITRLIIDHLPPGARRSSAAPTRVYTLRVAKQAGVRAALRGLAGKDTVDPIDTAIPQPGSIAESRHSSDACHELRVGPTVLTRTPSLTEALQTLESDVRLHVAETSKDGLFVHAGVVEWRGKAILIPGLSGSGKSTLVASLITAGAVYYSDEYAVLDWNGWVYPYPAPLRVRTATGTTRIRRLPEGTGGSRREKPLRAGLIVVTKFSAGAHWRPRRLSPGRGALALIANTVSVRQQPQLTLAALRCVLSSALVIESRRGEADETAPLLLRQMYEKTVRGSFGLQRAHAFSPRLKGGTYVTSCA